jgi:hypothetical protein
MSTEETKEMGKFHESTVASNEVTVTDSRYEDEKVIDMETVPSNPAADEGAAPATPPENGSPKPTGIRFALIFVGYILFNC